jgi:hypothetical protein
MTLRALTYGCVCAFALTVSASAQDQPRSTTPPSPQASAAVTVEGCLVREADVPGRRTPEGDVERVKRDEDYVLIDTKMIKGSAPSIEEQAKQDPTPTGTSGTSSTSLLYKVEEIDRGQLAQNRGKRVQIDGMFQHLDRAAKPVSAGNDLVKLRGTAIRPVPGDCAKR